MARCVAGTPAAPEHYPVSFEYDADRQRLHVGAGIFADVRPEVWSYSVSGMKVVESWLDGRLAKPAGKTSSELDKVLPTQWIVCLCGTLRVQAVWGRRRAPVGVAPGFLATYPAVLGAVGHYREVSETLARHREQTKPDEDEDRKLNGKRIETRHEFVRSVDAARRG